MKVLEIQNRRYLGNKYKLVEFIDEVLKENQIEFKSFFDIFAGTAVVSRYYAKQGKTVFVNDLLLANYYAYETWFGSEPISKRKLHHMLKSYNKKELVEENYFSNTFGGTYFSNHDCRKIGYIRDDIDEQYHNKSINKRERAYLITSLIYSMDRIANTVGHYDAYRKNQELQDRFELLPLDVERQASKKNRFFREDANVLIEQVKADVLFLDPPYNSRQYSDAYHLLENVAQWDKPDVYGIAKKMERKHLKSEYCTTRAATALTDLVDRADCKYIVVTYNNMGSNGNDRSNAKITDEQMIEILQRRGVVTVYEKGYQCFNTGKTQLDDHKERIFLCKVNRRRRKKQEIIKIEEKQELVKSPMNYVGGKYRLLPQLLELFPKNIDHFVDCCCGGCNVAVNVTANQITCIDSNQYLIQIYQLFQSYQYEEIVEKVEEIVEKYQLSNSVLYGYKVYETNSSEGLGKYNKSAYMKLRDDYNKREQQDHEKLFMLLTLIFYSFNHQIRFNSTNDFNMPVGKRDFNTSIRRNLKAFCGRIQEQSIDFIHKDFREIRPENYDCSTFFYCDPPYLIAQASYNEANGWTREDEVALLDKLKQLSDCGVKFALSNVIRHRGKKNDILLQWAKDNKFVIRRLDYNYDNANYHSNSKKNKTIEVLVTNYRVRK